MNQKIKYLFIGKAEELKEIGEFPTQPLQEWLKDSRRIFNSYCSGGIEGKLEQRNKIKDKDYANNNYFFYISEQKLFFLSIVDSSYSESLVFKLFEDITKENIHLLRDDKGKLNSIGLSKLRDLISQYQNAEEKSTIGQINKDIDDLKGDMRKNVTKIMDNIEDVEGLKARSEIIKDKSGDFLQSSSDLKKAACWQNYKLWLIIAVIVIVIIIVIIIVATKGGDDKNNDNEITVKIVDGQAVVVDDNSRLLQESLNKIKFLSQSFTKN